MEDCCSWFPLQAGGIGRSSAASNGSFNAPGPHHEQEEQDVVISSHVQQQLKEISMLLEMEHHDDEHDDAVAPAPSLSSSTLQRSFSGSPDENSSSLTLTPASTITTTTSGHHNPAEVSSQQIPMPPVAYYGDHHHDQCYSNLVGTIPNLEDFLCAGPEAHHDQEQHANGHGSYSSGAFRPYTRHLGPKKRPLKQGGGGGQRAIKSAMSVLTRMHMENVARWQRYQMEMAAAAAAAPSESNLNQLQHVLSERKRREKLNDSFKALKTVLPPGLKKDKASLLLRARDYVNTLMSRISELEEKNRMLVESQLYRDDYRDNQDEVSSKKIKIDISRPALKETSQEFYLKIMVRSGCNAMDDIVTLLQRLKEMRDVKLVAMDTGVPLRKEIQQITITLHLKSSRSDDNFLKESIMNTVKGVMRSKIEIA